MSTPPHFYFDYNASTPIDPRVFEVFAHQAHQEVGNPSSTHHFGRLANKALKAARKEIADFFRFKEQDVTFTSGGTEGAALLINGYLKDKKNAHILSSSVEHASVFETLKQQEKEGCMLTWLSVSEKGCISLEELEKAINLKTKLIVVMAANNETGVLNDLQGIAKIAEKYDIPLVVDGVCWLGKAKIEIPQGVSAIFFSGHKIYAPKGVGFILSRPSFKFSPLFIGGGQEVGRRAGTENLPGIVALAKAVSLLGDEGEIQKIQTLRDYFESEIIKKFPFVVVNGKGSRVCNTSNLSFVDISGEELLMKLDLAGIAVSHGSACSSGSLEPSRILKEMKLPQKIIDSALRFSFGRMTTKDEIERALSTISNLLER